MSKVVSVRNPGKAPIRASAGASIVRLEAGKTRALPEVIAIRLVEAGAEIVDERSDAGGGKSGGRRAKKRTGDDEGGEPSSSSWGELRTRLFAVFGEMMDEVEPAEWVAGVNPRPRAGAVRARIGDDEITVAQITRAWEEYLSDADRKVRGTAGAGDAG